jgi:hypothetical protein
VVSSVPSSATPTGKLITRLLIEKRTLNAAILSVAFGSKAVVQTDSSSMAALGWKADTPPGRISTLFATGCSDALSTPDSNRC